MGLQNQENTKIIIFQTVCGGDDWVQCYPGGVQGAEQEQDQEAAGDCWQAGHWWGAGADAGGI